MKAEGFEKDWSRERPCFCDQGREGFVVCIVQEKMPVKGAALQVEEKAAFGRKFQKEDQDDAIQTKFST